MNTTDTDTTRVTVTLNLLKHDPSDPLPLYWPSQSKQAVLCLDTETGRAWIEAMERGTCHAKRAVREWLIPGGEYLTTDGANRLLEDMVNDLQAVLDYDGDEWDIYSPQQQLSVDLQDLDLDAQGYECGQFLYASEWLDPSLRFFWFDKPVGRMLPYTRAEIDVSGETYSIDANTSDEALRDLAERLEAEVEEVSTVPTVVHGMLRALESLRDECEASDDED